MEQTHPASRDCYQRVIAAELSACFPIVTRLIISADASMNQTLIIVPTYNERENLPRMAQRLLGLPVPVDMLVVDDNSPDGNQPQHARCPPILAYKRAGIANE